MSQLGQALGYGLISAAILGLSAMAMTLQFGVTRHVNFAHGELLTIAAFAMIVAQHVTDNLLFDTLVAVVASTVAAGLLNLLVLRPFRRATDRLSVMLIVTFAVSQIIQNLLALGFGLNYVVLNVPIEVAKHVGPFLWTSLDEVIIIAAMCVFALTFVLLQYTSFGRAQRAVADDPVLARVVGIKSNRVIWQTWLLVGALTGLAGAALAMTTSVFNNQLGFNYLLVTFAAIIVGGLGKVHGALVGALIIGLVTEVSGSYLESGYKQVFALLLLVVVLLVRPTGIFKTLIPDTKA